MIIFACFNLFGWHFGDPISIYTSLGFLCSGLIGSLLIIGKKSQANFIAATLLLMGFYLLYIINLDISQAPALFNFAEEQNLGLSQLPSFRSLVLFILFATSILLASFAKTKCFWLATFGSLILSVGFVSFIDSVFDIQSVYLLWRNTRITIVSSILFTAMGAVLILFSNKKGVASGHTWWHWAIAIIGCVGTLYCWQAVKSYELIKLSNSGFSQVYYNDTLVVILGVFSTLMVAIFFRMNMFQNSDKTTYFYGFVPTIIFVMSLQLSIIVYFFLHSNFRTNTHLKFETNFQTQTSKLVQGLKKYTEVLFIIKDVFNVSEFITKDEFKVIAKRNIEKLPGLYGLGWIQKVASKDQLQFEQAMSKELNRDYFLFSHIETSKISTVSANDDRYPIVYMEPSNANLDFLGLEMQNFDYFKSVTREHIKDEVVTTSGHFSFFRNGAPEKGVLSLLSVTKDSGDIKTSEARIKNQNGFVFSLFNSQQAIQSILVSIKQEFGIDLLIKESNESGYEKLYQSDVGKRRLTHQWGGFSIRVNDTLFQELQINFANQKWTIRAKAGDSIIYPTWQPSNLFAPLLVLLVGCGIALISKKRNLDIYKLKALQSELEISMVEAQRSNKAKSDFLANMSHEIRTPMNAIIGLSYLALQTKLSPKQRNFISKVHGSGESLLEIINDILDFSKIEAGKLDMEKTSFSLETVLQNFINLIGLRSEDHQLELILDVSQKFPMNLIGDPLRLGQILINLGGNATKFTREGDIVLKVSVMEQNLDKLTLLFSISDTGIGMSKKDISGLFQSFSQADSSTTRKFGGTGLGLSISKRLCELMNGEIWIESEVGKGSTFNFTAQFEIDHDAEQIKTPVSDELKKMKILIVDSNPKVVDSIHACLASNGLDVSDATCIDTAMEELKFAAQTGNAYDLMLIDWEMPKISGIEFIQSIQANKDIPELKSVLMTTLYSKTRLYKMAIDFKFEIESTIDKPMTPWSLLTELSDFLVNQSDVAIDQKYPPKLEENTASKLIGARILLVEDNKVNQLLAVALLKQAKLEVTVVENGQLALDILNEQEFDGILMDIQMPEMDGYTATKLIRKQQKFKHLPIIAMTANVMASDIIKIKAAGMNDHIGKPLDIKGMYITIAKYVTNKNRTI